MSDYWVAQIARLEDIEDLAEKLNEIYFPRHNPYVALYYCCKNVRLERFISQTYSKITRLH